MTAKKIKEWKKEMEVLDKVQETKKDIVENKKTKKLVGLKIKNFFKHNFLFLIGVILLIYKGIFLNCTLEIELNTDVFYYMLIASLLIMSPIINHKNKFALIYLNIIYAIITTIIYANFLYYSYSTNFLSFYQIENLKYAKEIGSGVLTLINIKNIFIFWFDNIALLIVSLIANKKMKNSVYKNKILKIFMILIILVLNIHIVNKNINGIYDFRKYNKSLIVQEASIYYYHYKDAEEYISNLFVKEKVDEDKLQEIYNKNLDEKSGETKYFGIAKEKNVIILQLESLNEYIINKKVNGKEIMPNLNRFFQENIYCSDMYNQGLGTTADSEFEMENSMYPLENGYVFQKYYNNTWLDIYTTLRKNGYYTSFMHPNSSTFWNRDEVYHTGYHIDEYNDIKQFPNIEKAGEFYSDEGFFRQAVDKMNNYKEKFCTTLVSVTTHIPFELDGVSNLENKVTITKEDVKAYKDETFQNYLISCNFVDYAFGKLIEDLEKTGLMEESIFIVYGDHGAGLACIDDIKRLYEENGIDYTEIDDATKEVHVPFGIKVPGLDANDYNHIINRAVAKIDIKPTVLDLLGQKDNFSLGESIFSNKDYSFVKGLGCITSKYCNINDKYYNRENLNGMSNWEEIENLQNLQKKMEDEIYLSDSIIKNNLLE